MEDLSKLSKAVADRRAEMVSSAIRDFGSRSRHEILMSEIFPIFTNLRYTMKHLKGRMREKRRGIILRSFPLERAVFRQARANLISLLTPPYGKRANRFIKLLAWCGLILPPLWDIFYGQEGLDEPERCQYRAYSADCLRASFHSPRSMGAAGGL